MFVSKKAYSFPLLPLLIDFGLLNTTDVHLK